MCFCLCEERFLCDAAVVLQGCSVHEPSNGISSHSTPSPDAEPVSRDGHAALAMTSKTKGRTALRALQSCNPAIFARKFILRAALSAIFFKAGFNKTACFEKDGGERGITPGILPFALRAVLRTFKFAPGKFVEPRVLIRATPSSILFKAGFNSACFEKDGGERGIRTLDEALNPILP